MNFKFCDLISVEVTAEKFLLMSKWAVSNLEYNPLLAGVY